MTKLTIDDVCSILLGFGGEGLSNIFSTSDIPNDTIHSSQASILPVLLSALLDSLQCISESLGSLLDADLGSQSARVGEC